MHYPPAGLSTGQDVRRSPWLAGRAGGVWDVRQSSRLAPFLAHMPCHFARLLQKLQHRLS